VVTADVPMGLFPLATATGIPRSTLRIMLAEVAPAAFTNAGTPMYTMAQAKEAAAKKGDNATPHGEVKRLVDQERLRKFKLANDIAAGHLIPKAHVISAMSAACSKWGELRLQIESEMPVAVVGKDLPGTREAVKQWMVRISQVLQSLSDAMPQEDPKP
jgi:hypothetical protein